jgi:hypothetical protein
MHCDAFPSSLRTSLQPSALGLGARFAVTRGQPLDQASGLCPSDSPPMAGKQYLRKCFLVGKIFYEVTPLFHESMGRTNLAKVRLLMRHPLFPK